MWPWLRGPMLRCMPISRPFLLAAAWLAVLAPGAAAAPGDLDPSFGAGGQVTIVHHPNWTQEHVVSTAALPDGRVLMLTRTSSAPTVFSVLRLLPDGRPDLSYSGDGRALVSASSSLAVVGMVATPGGKAVVAGNLGSSNRDVVLFRLLADGGRDGESPLDTSFNKFGSLTLDSGADDSAVALAQAPDGKLVLAGEIEDTLVVWRVRAHGADVKHGALDETFDTDGAAVFDFGTAGDLMGALVLPDGRILVTAYGAGVVRLKAAGGSGAVNGAVDTTFGKDGVAALPVDPDTFALQADGRIVVAGRNGSVTVVALLADGQPDPGFGSNGRLDVSLGPGGILGALALQPDGKVLIGGSIFDQREEWAVARVDSTGLDRSFHGGVVRLEPMHSTTDLRALTVDASGRIIVGGDAGPDMVVARLLTAGDPEAPPVIEPRAEPVVAPGTAPVTAPSSAPRARITVKPRRIGRARRVRFRFTADQRATFQCRLDRRRWKRCRSGVRFAVRRGRHRFQVRARNANGLGPVASATFRVR